MDFRESCSALEKMIDNKLYMHYDIPKSSLKFLMSYIYKNLHSNVISGFLFLYQHSSSSKTLFLNHTYVPWTILSTLPVSSHKIIIVTHYEEE